MFYLSLQKILGVLVALKVHIATNQTHKRHLFNSKAIHRDPVVIGVEPRGKEKILSRRSYVFTYLGESCILRNMNLVKHQPFETLLADVSVGSTSATEKTSCDEEWYGLEYTIELSRRDRKASEASTSTAGEHSRVCIFAGFGYGSLPYSPHH